MQRRKIQGKKGEKEGNGDVEEKSPKMKRRKGKNMQRTEGKKGKRRKKRGKRKSTGRK